MCNNQLKVKSCRDVFRTWSYNDPQIKKVFILQGWLIPFWIGNFVGVKMRCEEACVEAEQ